MYRKKKSGWLAHFDFKLVDVSSMLAAYFATVILRERPSVAATVAGAVFIAMLGFLLSIMLELHNHVLHRKPIREFVISFFFIGFCETADIVYIVNIHAVKISWTTALLFLTAGIALDYVAKLVYKFLVKKGLSSYNRKCKMILVALDDNIESSIGRLENRSFGQVEIAGVVVINSMKYRVGDTIRGYKFVADIKELPAYLQTQWIDEVLMNLPSFRAPRDVIAKLTEMGIATHRVIEYAIDKHQNKVVETIADYTCLTESVRVVPSTQMFAKRVMDFVIGIIGSLFTIILTIFIGPLIFISDPGPIFFLQPRIGKGGRVFKMVKFRSMYKDAEARKKDLMAKNQIADGMMFKMDNDPRILGSGPDGTKKGIGWFIRKFSIDEFPQFFNVIKGDMSIVGTRPPTLDEWEKYGSSHRARMAIRPGITGMWQANGRSDITDFEKVVALDMEYIRNMDTWFDIKLIFKTALNMVKGSGAK